MTRISQPQSESHLWGPAGLLRGTIIAGDYEQFVFPLLFDKRLCDAHVVEKAAILAESPGQKDSAAYAEKDESAFTCVATLEAIRAKDGSLSILLHVGTGTTDGPTNSDSVGAGVLTPDDAISEWLESSTKLRTTLTELTERNGAPHGK